MKIPVNFRDADSKDRFKDPERFGELLVDTSTLLDEKDSTSAAIILQNFADENKIIKRGITDGEGVRGYIFSKTVFDKLLDGKEGVVVKFGLASDELQLIFVPIEKEGQDEQGENKYVANYDLAKSTYIRFAPSPDPILSIPPNGDE